MTDERKEWKGAENDRHFKRPTSEIVAPPKNNRLLLLTHSFPCLSHWGISDSVIILIIETSECL
jgi:hypothetical protein